MVILIDNNNTPRITVKSNLIQYANAVDTVIFVTPRLYNGLDMSNFNPRLQYILPVSKKVKTVELEVDELDYKGLLAKDETSTTVANGTTTTTITENTYISYKLSAGAFNFTSEPGNVEFTINWHRTELDEEGVETVYLSRKTDIGYIPITSVSAYDIIPNEAFTDIDKRLAEADNTAKKYFDIIESIVADSVVTDVVIDEESGKLVLSSINKLVGAGIPLEDIYKLVGNAIIGADEDSVQDGITHLDEL